MIGKTVDKRADIWAFGVVLYEMLALRSLFAGENVSQTLARVAERQPDFSIPPPNLHPKIMEMLQSCLVKEAKNRCHDIADVRIDLQKVLADPSSKGAGEGLRRINIVINWFEVFVFSESGTTFGSWSGLSLIAWTNIKLRGYKDEY